MRIDYFRYLFNRELDIFHLKENIMLYKKPFCIYNKETGEDVTFKTLDEALEYKIGEETVKQIIEQMDKPYMPTLNGGRGSSSGSGDNKEFKFGHASGGGGGSGGEKEDLLPAVANTRIKSKTPEGALAEFKRNHLLADREFSYSVDENGYVTGYKQGSATSVTVPSHGRQARGRMNTIIHNHPNGSAFSDTDLHTWSSDRRAKSIIASGKKYDYKVTKGTHFNAQGMSKAVRTAKMRGKDYDDAVDKWLKKNQKKFGYTYSRTKN